MILKTRVSLLSEKRLRKLYVTWAEAHLNFDYFRLHKLNAIKPIGGAAAQQTACWEAC